jgi:adenylate kinase family enzyme
MVTSTHAEKHSRMQRVLVVGTSGVGKTTLAMEMQRVTGLPVHHLDLLGWEAGWVRREAEEFAHDVDALMKGKRWVIEGNYIATLPSRVGRADTLVLIDLPLWLCLVRVFRRWWKDRNRVRHDLPKGCVEPLPWTFLTWVLTAPPRRQQVWVEVAAKNPNVRFIHLKSARQVDAFVKEFSHEQE